MAHQLLIRVEPLHRLTVTVVQEQVVEVETLRVVQVILEVTVPLKELMVDRLLLTLVGTLPVQVVEAVAVVPHQQALKAQVMVVKEVTELT